MRLVINSHNALLKSIDEIEKHHKNIESIRSSLDYDIDGIVYKIDDLSLQKDSVIPQILQGGQPRINFLLRKLYQKLKQ